MIVALLVALVCCSIATGWWIGSRQPAPPPLSLQSFEEIEVVGVVDDERIAEAIAVFKGITSKINTKSAQAYWSLGKLLARGVDEFDSDSDTNAPDDPSLLFEQAARLNPMNFKPDGTRVRLVELRTPEVEQREEREVQKRRERILDEMHEGKHSFKYADEL
jgi:hypothetical protein